MGGSDIGRAGSGAPGSPSRPRWRMRHGRFWEVAVGVATAVVVLLLVFVGSGLLVRSGSTSATVTVTEVQWVIVQGTTSRGFGWFGPSYVNVTNADGLPIGVHAGGHLTFSLLLANLDAKNHTISRAVAGPPFAVASTTPGVPALVVTGEDDFDFAVTVTAPSPSSSGNYTLVVTITAE